MCHQPAQPGWPTRQLAEFLKLIQGPSWRSLWEAFWKHGLLQPPFDSNQEIILNSYFCMPVSLELTYCHGVL